MSHVLSTRLNLNFIKLLQKILVPSRHYGYSLRDNVGVISQAVLSEGKRVHYLPLQREQLCTSATLHF
ncbi:hypothetical protein [Trichormus azollae]|uniref:hypothetical protein n=1 Tax=Trichormus azollae TaxID=1164 RepID=UPI00117C71D4|nr:hypothetical protein [Trichormus azollae]